MKKLHLMILSVCFIPSLWAQPPSPKQLSHMFTDVVKEVNPAVVTIKSTKIVKWEGRRFRHPLEEFFGEDFFRRFYDTPQKSHILGSGVVVDAAEGYILTNNHVVEGADDISVVLMDEREFTAKVVGTDDLSDLAVLQIEAGNLKEARFGDSDDLEVGEWVLAIGSPFSDNLSHTVTAGIVSAKGRSRILRGNRYEDFIQTDAAINPGNSGGPLVNLNGELVGINTAIATGGFSRGNLGVGFAIPINLAKKIMNDLITEGRVIRAWLGVYIQDVDDGIAKATGLPDRQGAAVLEVVEDSPAEKAGFKVYDVIVEFDGKKVRDSSHLRNLVSTTRPGTRAAVEIIRKKRKRTLRVHLAEIDRDETAFASRESGSTRLGLRVENVSSTVARDCRLEADETGVVVVEISPASVAAKEGFQPCDVITRIGDNEITSVKDFRRAVRAKDNETILFLINRAGFPMFLAIENP